MDVVLSILAVVLGIVGIIGSIIPVIPGVIVSYAGLLCAFFTKDSHIGTATVLILLVISIAVLVVDYILPGYLTKLFGGSKAAIFGATVGMIVGLFYSPPIGLVVGTFLGALVGELIHDHTNLGKAFKSALGAMLSFIVGTGIKFVTTCCIFFFICLDIFPKVADWIAGLFV